MEGGGGVRGSGIQRGMEYEEGGGGEGKGRGVVCRKGWSVRREGGVVCRRESRKECEERGRGCVSREECAHKVQRCKPS